MNLKYFFEDERSYQCSLLSKLNKIAYFEKDMNIVDKKMNLILWVGMLIVLSQKIHIYSEKNEKNSIHFSQNPTIFF